MLRFRLIFVMVMIFVFAVAAMPAAAQEGGDGPPRVGLRPDAPTYALHGPYWVGTLRPSVTATDLHPTKADVWYPALNPDGKEEAVSFFEFGAPIVGHALKDANSDGEHGPYPLIILAHGVNGQHLGMVYLAEHLASYGFVVMAIDYADNFGAAQSASPSAALYSRPRDVSWQLDQADQLTANPGALQGMIDTEHVAVVGHSLGGYTALAAGGARLDFTSETSWCKLYPDMTVPPELGGVNPCRLVGGDPEDIVDLAGLDTPPATLWPSWGDPRVDAIVPLAPAVLFYGEESLSGVTAPALVIIGGKDRFVFSENPLYRAYAYEGLSSAQKSYVEFNNADHLIFNNDCEAHPLALEANITWFCSDPVWDMNRAHDLINHFTTAFLLDVLKGDAEAHAALLPDAVSFPGITYETTMQ